MENINLLGHNTSYNTLITWVNGFKKNLKNNKFKKTVLISGPIGIGKTTLVKKIAKESKRNLITYDCCELSKNNKNTDKETDTNIKFIQKIVTQNSLVPTIIAFETANALTGKLITSMKKIITKTKTPIFIICDDPYPLKSLSKECLEIKLKRVSVQTIKKYILKKKIYSGPDNGYLEKLIESQGNDIRHIILSLENGLIPNKDTDGRLNIFTAVADIFNRDVPKIKKEKAFWEDYNLIPMMVQENYIPKSENFKKYDSKKQLKILNYLTETADAITDLDICNYKINSNENGKNYDMLPLACQLTIRATKKAHKKIMPFPGPKFPQVLGKTSTQRANNDKLNHIALYSNQHIIGNSFRLQFLPNFYNILLDHIKNENYENAIELLKTYNISKNDFFEVFDKVSSWSKKDIMTKVASTNKSALTRKYNKSLK